MKKSRSMLRFSIALAAPLVGLPVTSALAAEPTTVEEAGAAAQHAADLADFYSQLGGVGYKTGLEQRSTAEARRYSALADELAARQSQSLGSTYQQLYPSYVPIKPLPPQD